MTIPIRRMRTMVRWRAADFKQPCDAGPRGARRRLLEQSQVFWSAGALLTIARFGLAFLVVAATFYVAGGIGGFVYGLVRRSRSANA